MVLECWMRISKCGLELSISFPIVLHSHPIISFIGNGIVEAFPNWLDESLIRVVSHDVRDAVVAEFAKSEVILESEVDQTFSTLPEILHLQSINRDNSVEDSIIRLWRGRLFRTHDTTQSLQHLTSWPFVNVYLYRNISIRKIYCLISNTWKKNGLVNALTEHVENKVSVLCRSFTWK